MDIIKRLETEHSKTLTTAIVTYIGDDRKRFKELMDVFLKDEYRLTQRAAWPLSYVAIEHPGLMTPYYAQLIKKLQEPGHHPAIGRNILRAFAELDIPEKYHAVLIDCCFKFILDQTSPVAIKAFAITLAAKISLHYPDLKKELVLVLNDLNQYPQLPAIKSRIKSAFKVLNLKV